MLVFNKSDKFEKFGQSSICSCTDTTLSKTEKTVFTERSKSHSNQGLKKKKIRKSKLRMI